MASATTADGGIPPAVAVTEPTQLAEEVAELQIKEETGHEVVPVATAADAAADATTAPATAETATALPAHRSHDPQYNQKRSDPFQFGSRYLNEDDDVFEFNAWDHVETDDAYKEYAEQQFSMQRQSPVSDFDKNRFNSNPAKWWNLFYKNNTANFFKNRKWLQQEFPILDQVTKEDAGPQVVLEIGAGAGNTAFPILANNRNPQLRVHACDFSKAAVDVMRRQEEYDPAHIQADVWDVAGDELPPDIAPGTVDVAILIFIFSALSPAQWEKAVSNVHAVLKPGGVVCFRDYGRGDLAQVRFKKGRYLDENFYIRGDGTRVYFFEKDEIAKIWASAAPTGKLEESAEPAQDLPSQQPESAGVPRFDIEDLDMDQRLIVNRARKLKMYRCWLQGRFRKKQ